MSDDLNTFFSNTVKDVKNLKTTPDDDTLLLLYGYYKQAIIGNINIPKPSVLDFKGSKKWNAWNKCKNMEKDQAKLHYIKLVMSLMQND